MFTQARPIAAKVSIVVVAGLVVIAGCAPSADLKSTDSKPTASTPSMGATSAATDTSQTEAHAHKPGAHGGTIVSIGLDSYHAEAVVEKGGNLKLLMLGQDESRLLEVEKQSLKAYVKVDGASEAVAVELLPVPQDGDAEGKTSQFIASLPEELRARELDVTIPNIRVQGERFRIGFSTRQVHAGGHEDMPVAATGSEEELLYLTPGGKYTLADIAANGHVTASKKFKGIPSNHNAKPDAGDRLCPISSTKANPKFTWVIDGQNYQFCCPPCVDEFVKLAKERPEELKPADSYVKK
jgi:hypothetical protein